MSTGNAWKITTRSGATWFISSMSHVDKYAYLQEYFMCRKPERTLNKCMFEKLVRLSRSRWPTTLTTNLHSTLVWQGLTKTIPGAQEGRTPVHELEKPIFKAIQK